MGEKHWSKLLGVTGIGVQASSDDRERFDEGENNFEVDMTLNKLASDIAKIEGKKSQARVCDIREILSILADMLAADDDAEIYVILMDAGMKRAEKQSKQVKHS